MEAGVVQAHEGGRATTHNHVLQACHAAYGLNDETEVHGCTKNPHPSDVGVVADSIPTDEFTTSWTR